MRKPKFTDGHRFPKPYVKAKDMEPNYLAEKFERMRKAMEAERKANEQEIEAKVRRLA